MTKKEKMNFISSLDMDNTNFEIKISDFGFSTQLKNFEELNSVACGTPMYQSP